MVEINAVSAAIATVAFIGRTFLLFIKQIPLLQAGHEGAAGPRRQDRTISLCASLPDR